MSNTSTQKKMALYVDCTETVNTGLNTGIQRVVRKIIFSSHECFDIVPVYFDGKGFQKIPKSKLLPSSSWARWVQAVSKSPFANLAKKGFRIWVFIKSAFKRILNNPSKDYHIQLSPGDILLLADSVRSDNLIKYLQELRPRKIQIFQIIFDLLPMTHPDFFRKEDSEAFCRRVRKIPTYCDKVFAISKKVASDVQKLLDFKQVDYFHLGADFQLGSETLDSVQTHYPPGDYFLSVGTLEPRKNHLHILKSFHSLWKDGFKTNLVFIGRMGWKSEKLLEAIKETQNNFPDRFLWLDSASDKTLEGYYLGAKAIICASVDEGFGLPIIEALSRGRPVICSDIEIFREVGTEFCTFFELEQMNGPNSLTDILKTDRIRNDIQNFKWLSWQESVSLLLSKIGKEAGSQVNK